MPERNDPYAQFNFVLKIDGIDVAGFSEVSGISSESDIIEYREGSDASRVRKLPALRKVGNITLKRGYTQNLELWNWRKTTLDGLTQRKNGAVVLRDEHSNDKLRWEFFEGPALNATANEAAIESIEIAIETLELKLPS